MLVGIVVVAVPIIDILRVKTRGASVKAQFVALLKDEFAYAVGLVGVLLVGQGYH